MLFFFPKLWEASNLSVSSGSARANNHWNGIFLCGGSSSNILSMNIVTNAGHTGIELSVSFNNTILGNLVANNNGWAGLSVYDSSGSNITHNNFVNNAVQVRVANSTSVWDYGYPYGGNYWSDHIGSDLYCGPYQNITGSDCIGDTQRFIDSSNKDMYPFVTENWWLKGAFWASVLTEGTGTTSPSSETYGFPYSTNVTVVAVETDLDWRFDHWILDGADAGANYSIVVRMDMNHTLKAVFVQIPFDFNVSTFPSSQKVAAGMSASFTVTVTLLEGLPQQVRLSLQGLPASVGSYSIMPSLGTPNFTAVLTVYTLFNAPPGTYSLAVNGTHGELSKTANLTLVVLAPTVLTMRINRTVVRIGQQVTISGQLLPSPGSTQKIYIFYRLHDSTTWSLATTTNTNTTGHYSLTATVPSWLSPGTYDLVAVWIDLTHFNYAISPINTFTIKP